MSHSDEQRLSAESIYVSICANRHENNISSSGQLLLYSRSNCPVLYDLQNKQQPHLLIGHTKEVNGQKFIASSEKDDAKYIISTAYDNRAIIWKVNKQLDGLKSDILFNFQSPLSSEFVTRCSKKINASNFLSVTTTLENFIYIWNDDQLSDSIKVSYCCLDARIHSLDYEKVDITLLFLSGSDNIVHIFQIVEFKLKHLLDLTGHNDWIKCVDIISLPQRAQEFLIASASQDSYVRVWHMKLVNREIAPTQVRTAISEVLSTNSDAPNRLIATLETVLAGHEGIVTSLCWFKKVEPYLQLITCSADKNVVIWQSQLISGQDSNFSAASDIYEQAPASAGVWKEIGRYGETGETNLPFLSVCLSEDEEIFYAHSLRGAIHSWSKQGDEWLPGRTIMGHFDSVTDLCWDKSCSYLLTCSLDKTCRLHSVAKTDKLWHELARPQVHGHEINCLISLGFTKFATGAEEKTIRTYEATQFFLKNYKALSDKSQPIEPISIENFPKHAQLPALGLSIRGANSPYDVGTDTEKKGAGDASDAWTGTSKLAERLASIDHLTELPAEEILLQSTLWWETSKLFGHGNELFALAATSNGNYMASASKANRSDLATILIWECTKFRKVATIEHHTLTITRLRFSPDDRYLLSASRDRTWCLSERTGQVRSAYKKLIGTKKGNAVHDRIIWDIAWTYDSKYFLTASRDKKAIMWCVRDLVEKASSGSEAVQHVSCEVFDGSIQAVDSPNSHLKSLNSCEYLFALGFEEGLLKLVSINLSSESSIRWQTLGSFQNFHHLPIRRLSFKPTLEDESSVLLASGGDDCIVKLTRVKVNKLE